MLSVEPELPRGVFHGKVLPGLCPENVFLLFTVGLFLAHKSSEVTLHSETFRLRSQLSLVVLAFCLPLFIAIETHSQEVKN